MAMNNPMSLQIIIHLYAAIAALMVGITVLFLKKGTVLHRSLGRIWVLVMLVAAGSSFWIQEIGGIAGFSWIHLLSVWTLLSLGYAVYFIRNGRVAEHRKAMIGTFIGLTIAGLLALFSGRRLATLIFGG
jgi:uncharacterized membrane protein